MKTNEKLETIIEIANRTQTEPKTLVKKYKQYRIHLDEESALETLKIEYRADQKYGLSYEV